MKTNTILTETAPGIIATAAIAFSLFIPISPDRLAGVVTVLMLLGIAALEYRVSWKNPFGR